MPCIVLVATVSCLLLQVLRSGFSQQVQLLQLSLMLLVSITSMIPCTALGSLFPAFQAVQHPAMEQKEALCCTLEGTPVCCASWHFVVTSQRTMFRLRQTRDTHSNDLLKNVDHK